MNRLLAATRTDVTLQARNRLYGISILFAAVVAVALAWLSNPQSLHRVVPMVVLFVVGGSTLLYAIAMLLLERDDGTLDAVAVSPVRPWEYIGAKVVSLTLLAVAEGLVFIVGGVLWIDASALNGASLPMLVLGLVGLGSMLTLLGVVIVVRYDRLTEALMPMGLIGLVLQLPGLHYVGALPNTLALAIPTAPPAMFIRGAFVPLDGWEWGYGLAGTLFFTIWAGIWAHKAFVHFVIHKGVAP